MSAVDHLEIVSVNRPMKRGRAVALGRVFHVGAAPDERLHGRAIAPLDGVNQSAPSPDAAATQNG